MPIEHIIQALNPRRSPVRKMSIAFTALLGGSLATFACRTQQDGASAAVQHSIEPAPSAVPSPARTDGPTAGPAPDRALPSPNYLSHAAREALATQMQRHGDDMSDLLWAVIFLDDATVQEVANEIVEGRNMFRDSDSFLGAHAQGDDDAQANSNHGDRRQQNDLEQRLLRDLAERQEAFMTQTRRLAKTAELHDRGGIASAYAGVTQSCVECHQVYLGREAQPAEPLQEAP